MASDELKPCAHCGEVPAGPAKLGGSDERYGYNFTITIGCRCGVSVSRKSHEDKSGWCNDTGQATLAVVEAWNRRAQDFDAMRQRVELLERLLSTARDYVYSELEERKAAMAGYPHKWQQEEADLAEIDAALAQQP